MRFRPANIRLINRRSIQPRLLLALSSKDEKSKNNNKNNPTDLQRLTGHSISGNSRFRRRDGGPSLNIFFVYTHATLSLDTHRGTVGS
jgi:hypothetical protein